MVKVVAARSADLRAFGRRDESVRTDPDNVLVLAQCIDCCLDASYTSVLCRVTWEKTE
jgi:hypothetical protein